MTTMPRTPTAAWTPLCSVGDLSPLRGTRALLDGEPLALLLVDGRVHALGNVDPWTGESTLDRGLVAQRGQVLALVAPPHGNAFDLETGTCLDDPAVAVPVHEATVHRGVVHVRREPAPILAAVPDPVAA